MNSGSAVVCFTIVDAASATVTALSLLAFVPRRSVRRRLVLCVCVFASASFYVSCPHVLVGWCSDNGAESTLRSTLRWQSTSRDRSLLLAARAKTHSRSSKRCAGGGVGTRL